MSVNRSLWSGVRLSHFATSAVALLSSMLISGCGESSQLDAATSADVTYRVEVSGIGMTKGSADVTYITPDGGIAQEGNLTSGNIYNGSFPAGSFVYMSAQAMEESSTISCSITVDGQVVSSNESRGDFVIATCEGEATPCPECQEAAAEALAAEAAEVPYGFARFQDSDLFYDINELPDNSCGNVTCISIDVVTTKRCPQGILVYAQQLNRSGAETGSDGSRIEQPVEPGEKVSIDLGWESNPDGGSVAIEFLTCIGGG